MRQNRIRLTSRILLLLSLVGLAVTALIAQENPQAILWFVVYEVSIGIAFMFIRCGVCRHPVHKHYVTVFGATFPYWSILLPRRCPRCHTAIPWRGHVADGHVRDRELGERPPDGPTTRLDKRTLSIALAALGVVNLVGGLGLSVIVDRRFMWAAIVVPGAAVVGMYLLRRSKTPGP